MNSSHAVTSRCSTRHADTAAAASFSSQHVERVHSLPWQLHQTFQTCCAACVCVVLCRVCLQAAGAQLIVDMADPDSFWRPMFRCVLARGWGMVMPSACMSVPPSTSCCQCATADTHAASPTSSLQLLVFVSRTQAAEVSACLPDASAAMLMPCPVLLCLFPPSLLPPVRCQPSLVCLTTGTSLIPTCRSCKTLIR